MEATCYSETAVDFQRTARRYIPEDRRILLNPIEPLNLSKSYALKIGPDLAETTPRLHYRRYRRLPRVSVSGWQKRWLGGLRNWGAVSCVSKYAHWRAALVILRQTDELL
jgi:hypothetical protein